MIKSARFINYNLLPIIALTIIGGILRFYNFVEMSLSNDELSAISRLNYNSFSELINNGVMPDGHPAGVQVFLYYWTMLFGNSVFFVRLPFIIAGTLSIPLIYLISKKWFNNTSALFIASSITFLEYTLFYSQLSRPYSIGLFVILLNIYFWTKIFLNNDFKKSDILFYGITIALSAYTHYFNILTAVILFLSSFFFINKKRFIALFISGVISLILYLPHINIFINQFSIGGLGWLPKPESSWIWEYLFYSFNNSLLVLILFILIFTISIIFRIVRKNFKFNFPLLSLLIFVIVFLIGYFYSIYKSPIIQYSVLIFSFPFLLFFILGFISDIKNKVYLNLFLLFFSIVLFSSTFFEKKYYSKEHFGEFKKIAERISLWTQKVGLENITYITNVNKPYYLKYYLNDLKDSVEFKKSKFESKEEIKELIYVLKKSNTDYLIYSWSNVYNPYEITEVIKMYYPYLNDYSVHFNSEVFLFSKSNSIIKEYYSELKSISDDFENNLNINRDSINSASGKYSAFLNDKIEYGPTVRFKYSEIPKEACRIRISFKFILDSKDTIREACNVISIDNNGNNKYWTCFSLSSFCDNSKEWNEFVMIYDLTEKFDYKSDDLFSIYIWNKKFENINIDDLKINFVTTPHLHLLD